MIETNFIIHRRGPDRCFGVFEDDGATGYLYLFDPQDQKVFRHLHVYDRSEKVDVAADDVEVRWSSDGTKCGVLIWGAMHGIIDLALKREGRVWLEDRNTPGIADAEWLMGFDNS